MGNFFWFARLLFWGRPACRGMRAPCRWRLMTSLCFVGVITFPLIAGSGRSVLSGSVPIGFVFTIAFGRRPPSAIFAEGVVRCIIRITLIYDGNVRARVHWDERTMEIDSLRKNPFSSGIVRAPFFEHAKRILEYTLSTKDSMY